MKSKDCLKSIAKIIGKTEKKMKELYDDCDLTKPIRNDILQTTKSMAYEDIKEEIVKFKQSQKED